MINKKAKNETRRIRQIRKRKIIKGNSKCPRLCIFISHKHLYSQLIDDEKGCTIVYLSTLNKNLKENIKGKNKREIAQLLGNNIGKTALEAGIERVVFDKSGYKYNLRLKNFADAARGAGLKF